MAERHCSTSTACCWPLASPARHAGGGLADGGWLLTDTNGENVIRAAAPAQAEAWRLVAG